MAEVGTENEPFLREPLIEHIRVTAKELVEKEGTKTNDTDPDITVGYEVKKDYLEPYDSVIKSLLQDESVQSAKIVVVSPENSEKASIQAHLRLETKTQVVVLSLTEGEDPQLLEYSVYSPDSEIPYTDPTPIQGEVPYETLVTFDNLLKYREAK
jgi:hypothetical protein